MAFGKKKNEGPRPEIPSTIYVRVFEDGSISLYHEDKFEGYGDGDKLAVYQLSEVKTVSKVAQLI